MQCKDKQLISIVTLMYNLQNQTHQTFLTVLCRAMYHVKVMSCEILILTLLTALRAYKKND